MGSYGARLIEVFQQQGLLLSKWDGQSRRVLRAFQMHYRPSSF